jgi:predicted RNase H-like HicB family nuclease
MIKKKLILNYNVVFQEEKSGGYSVWVPDLPGCASQGESFDEAKENIQEAIQLYLEDAPVSAFKSAIGQIKQFFVPISVPIQTIHG